MQTRPVVPFTLVLTHRLVCMLGKTLKGDSRMRGCLSDMASYWSTEIIPIMNSVQCGEFRTSSPESWLSDTSGETLRFGSLDLIRHTCVNCDGGKVSECGLNYSSSQYFSCVASNFHSFFEAEEEQFQGMKSWRCASRDAQENHKMNSRGGRRTAKYLRPAGFVFATPFRCCMFS